MIHGGGMDVNMKEKDTQAPIENEASNGLKNDVYTIAMARTNDVHSATSQFFINIANNEFLNFTSETPQGYGYCVFGKVTAGESVVDQIKGVPTGTKGFHQDVPNENVIIESVTRV
jgi:peptidyl-prolyl cis-trans isomerase B (cyclophilin B)